MTINDERVVAAVRAAFDRYEEALRVNDASTLGELFWRSERTVRYGMGGEIGHGWEEIQGHRKLRPAIAGPWRTLSDTVITTFGDQFATVSTLFHRAEDPDMVGRQMQTWALMPEGWRIVAAHVSWVSKR